MTFKPGQSGNPKGKPPGPNKLTVELKDMIEGALKDVGGRAYLERQAEANPSAFLTLVGKLLPKDINAKIDAGGELRAYLLKLAAERGL